MVIGRYLFKVEFNIYENLYYIYILLYFIKKSKIRKFI